MSTEMATRSHSKKSSNRRTSRSPPLPASSTALCSRRGNARDYPTTSSCRWRRFLAGTWISRSTSAPGDRFALVFEEQFKDGGEDRRGSNHRGRVHQPRPSDSGRSLCRPYGPWRLLRARWEKHAQGVPSYPGQFHANQLAFQLQTPAPDSPQDACASRSRLCGSERHCGESIRRRKGRLRRDAKGGYGRTVILQHGSTYTTLYAHLARFSKGIRPGKRVEQGRIIGYVGSTGLATGPHLHYEFRVRGAHRDPLRVKLPTSRAACRGVHERLSERKREPLLAKLELTAPTSLANRGLTRSPGTAGGVGPEKTTPAIGPVTCRSPDHRSGTLNGKPATRV